MQSRFALWKQHRKEALSEYVNSLKSDRCTDCPRHEIPAAMQFDHRPGEEKYLHIRAIIDQALSFDTLKAEIAKCDLVCVGCHRLRTASRVQRASRYSCKQHDSFQIGCRMCGIADRRRIRSARLRREVDGLKRSKPCIDCGEVFAPLLMDWDHRPGEMKEFDISSAISGGWRLERIMNEIAKCDLVCCWCHVERTMNRREGGVLSKTG